MDEYAGRVLADRYRLPLPPSDEYEFAESRAFDTYSGQEVLVRQVPLPEVVEAEVLDADGLPEGFVARDGGVRRATARTTRRPAEPAVRRAIEAAQAAAQIPDHPRLDQVFDVFAEGGSLWIVSELVPARPLAALLAEKPLSPYRAAEVAADVLTALRVLHAHGWVHRNITARTVLVCDDGRVMLTGLAAGAAEEALCGYDPVPVRDFDGPAGAEGAPGGPGAAGPGGPRASRVSQVSQVPPVPRGSRAAGGEGGGNTGPAWNTGSPGAHSGTGPGAGAPRGVSGVGAGAQGATSPGGTFGAVVAGAQGIDAEAARRAAIEARAENGTPVGEPPAAGSAALARRALDPEGDARAARAGAIAAYRAGARAAARVHEQQRGGPAALPAPRPAPPADSSAPPAQASGHIVEQRPETPPPGQIADPYGVAHTRAWHGAQPRPGTTGTGTGQGAGHDTGGAFGQGEAQGFGQGASRDDEHDSGQGTGPDSRRGFGPEAGQGFGQGAGHGAGSGFGPDTGQGFGQGAGPDAGEGFGRGAGYGAGSGFGPEAGQGFSQGAGPDGGRGFGQGNGPNAGEGFGQGAGPSVGPGFSREADHGTGQGFGQGTGQGFVQGAGQGAGQGSGRNAGRGVGHGAGQGVDPGAARGYGHDVGQTLGNPSAQALGQGGGQARPALPGGGAGHGRVAPELPGGAPALVPGQQHSAVPVPPRGRWDELVAGAPPRRGPATALAAERARQARMAVVGPVTERWAPEQAGPVHENWQLAAPIGPATDLWALGALLFRAVQGHAPYPEENTAELVQLVCAEPPAFAEECGPLRPVVESLLRQDPTERLDFEELRGWLRSLVRSAPEPEAGAHVVAAPPVDPSRLPIVRRRYELVRRRRAGLPATSPHARHKRAKSERPVRPASRAGQDRPRRLGRNLVLLVLLLLVAAVAYAMVFMPKNDRTNGSDDRPADSAGQLSPTPRNSSGTGADGSASSEPRPDQTSPAGDKNPSGKPSSSTSQGHAPGVAAGFTLRKDSAGFQVAVANGWDRSPKNGRGQVVYSHGDFELIVVPGRDGTATYGSDPLTYQREREAELQPFRDSTWATSSGMRRIDVGGRTMAEGQFTWQNSAGQELYVRNLVIVQGGRYHIVQVRGPEAEMDEVTRLYEQASTTYQVTG
ncbi:protein kinase [Streptomyces sp. NPDC059466]|uniref:protein kinase n=1 Tax=Streptomyces sp. NPDC059466 TaxID=3346843 RepID=UPI0036C85E64